MSSNLVREEFISLLENLKSENKEEIVKTVFEINEKMLTAGVAWDDLLILDQNGNSAEPTHGVEDEIEENHETQPGDANLNPLNEDEKKEIEALISSIQKLKISEETKSEMDDFQVDLKENEIQQMDLRYLRALKSRLLS